MPATEEGQKTWEQTWTWLNTPPAAVVRTAQAPRAIPRGTPVTPTQQAAALSAFLGTVGE